MKFKRQDGMVHAIIIESQDDLDCVYKHFKNAVDYHLTSASKKELFCTRLIEFKNFEYIANGETFAETYVSADGILYNMYVSSNDGRVEAEMYKVVVKNVKDWDISNLQLVSKCLQSEWGENSTEYIMNLSAGYTGDISEYDMARIYSVCYLQGNLGHDYTCYDFSLDFEWLLRQGSDNEVFNRSMK